MKTPFASCGAALLTVFCFLAACLSVAHAAPKHELLASFSTPPKYPGYGVLTRGPDGYFWGATRTGGAYQFGTIYKVKADGSDWQTMLSFSGNGDFNAGSYPYSGLVSDDTGFLWGTTFAGGSGGFGTVFKVNAVTGVLSTVLEFNDNGANKGAHPYAGLVSDGAGWFWGTTCGGGANPGASFFGTVFKVSANTGELITLVQFTSNGAIGRGAFPYAGLVDDGAGFFWGTASSGGAFDFGTVFKVDAHTGWLTTVIEFGDDGTSLRGRGPHSSLVSDGAGSLWGTAEAGGSNGLGTVFKIAVATGVLTKVIDFSGTTGPNTGAAPWAGLVSDGMGFFWGTTRSGGTGNFGTVFKINTASGELASVLEFSDNGPANKGREPFAGLVSDGAGSLLGTTLQGGASGNGTVFKVNVATGGLTTLVDFALNVPANPYAGLVGDDAGFLWGTTRNGGAQGYGTVFKANAVSGGMTTVASFTGTAGSRKGAAPYAGLVRDDAGFFWGSTATGGSGNLGTVFKIEAATGAFSTVLEFSGNGPPNKGSTPYAGLANDGAGFFWGTTSAGGPATLSAPGGLGTVFKIHRVTGVLTTVAEFTGNGAANKGAGPFAPLVSDGAGFLWGTTIGGGSGSNNGGTVFKCNAATGELTTVAEFTGSSTSPRAGLVRVGADYFWGTRYASGSVFKIHATTGALTTFSLGSANPLAGLTIDTAGFLWGTTNSGTVSQGTIYKINPATGALTTVLAFTGNGTQPANGSNPGYGSLLKHTDGNLYGTTINGGPGASGTLFRLRFGPTPATQLANPVATTSATLRGLMNPNGDFTAASFEWGTDPALATFAVANAGNTASGVSLLPISKVLTGLLPGSTYYFRLCGINNENVLQRGDILSFTTRPNFESWKRLQLGDASAPDLGDPDGDGLTNLVEYGIPSVPNLPNLPPAAGVQTYADGPHLRMLIPRDPARSDVNVYVEAADSLDGPWMTLASSLGGAMFAGPGYVRGDGPYGGLRTVEIQDVANANLIPHRFMRARVVEP